MKSWRVLALAAIFSFGLVSCEDDKDEDDNPMPFPQELIIDGNRQGLGEALIFNYGAEPGGNVNLDLNILTDGLTIIYDNGIPDSVTGSGNLMYFEAWTSDSTFLSEGTYNLDTAFTENVFTISYGDIGNVVNGEYTGEFEMTKATFEVVRDNSVYTITGSGTLEDGKTFTFSFQNEIPIY